MGSSGEQARVHHCPAPKLTRLLSVRGCQLQAPPCLLCHQLVGKTQDPRIWGSWEGSVPWSVCFLSSLPNSVCIHSPWRQNLSLSPPAGDSDASSVAGVSSSGSVALVSRLVAVNSALNLASLPKLVHLCPPW